MGDTALLGGRTGEPGQGRAPGARWTGVLQVWRDLCRDHRPGNWVLSHGSWEEVN